MKSNVNLCQKSISGESTEPLNIGTSVKIRVVDLSKLQSSQMVESSNQSESTKRQDRRKTKHQLKPMSDEDFEFIEIDNY